MQVHYFQRYHDKENVATANTMLLLSRLYSYSPEKFFGFLKAELFSDLAEFEPEISFSMQTRRGNAVPDAEISQPTFKVVVETKLSDWFYTDQLIRHLSAFDNQTYKVLMTLAPVPMSEKKKKSFEAELREYNASRKYPVRHLNMTFERLAAAIQDVIDERDYEMQEVLDDYLDYCSEDKLIANVNAWKYMRMQLAGDTIDFNIQQNIYYDNAERRFRPHEYLGLYQRKCVRAIGKISAMITAEETPTGINYNAETGELTQERIDKIQLAIEDGKTHGYDLLAVKHRYFFVERFYATDFRKITPGPSRGTRIFDLSALLGTEKLPAVEEIAERLRKMTWE